MTSPDDESSSEAAKNGHLAGELQDVATKGVAETTPEELEQRRQMHADWEKNFGDKVRQWRRARSWSQEDVAERLRQQGFEMHQTTVAKIERGTRPLRVAEAAALAFIFRVPPLAVFHSPGPEEQPEQLKDLQLQMNRAEERLEHVAKALDHTGAIYATSVAHIQMLARRINEAAVEDETERESASETE